MLPALIHPPGRHRACASESDSSLAIICLPAYPPGHLRSLTPPRCPPRDPQGRVSRTAPRRRERACPRDGGWELRCAGWGWRRPALTLPAAGAAASSSSSSCTSTSAGGSRRAGGPRAVQGLMVGTGSESRRVRVPRAMRPPRPLRGSLSASESGGEAVGPAGRGVFCRAPQRRPSLPTQAFDGGSKGGKRWLRSRLRPPSPPTHRARSLRPGRRAQEVRKGRAPAGQVGEGPR